jgi:8-oxo-dGTP pyrophosphatase MutT (NUDIX family)
MKYNPVDVIKPKLYKDVFPYEEIPKVKFNNIQLPMNIPDSIWITDTTFRDGQQSMTSMDSQQMVKLFDFLHELDNESGIIKQTEFFLYSQKDRKAVEECLYELPAGLLNVAEEPVECALRELKEETGIEVSKLEQIYKFVSKDTKYYGYLCKTNCDKDSVTLQEGETISYLWLTKEEFFKFIESSKYIKSHKERIIKYLDTIR